MTYMIPRAIRLASWFPAPPLLGEFPVLLSRF